MTKTIETAAQVTFGKITIGFVLVNMIIEGLYLIAGMGLDFLFPLMEWMIISPNLNGNDVIFYIGAIFYLIWLHKAVKNLGESGLSLKHSPAWAVGSHFVPLVNLFVPLKVVRFLYAGSRSYAERINGTADADRTKIPVYVSLWWIFYLVPRFFEAGLRYTHHFTFLGGKGWLFYSGMMIASGYFLIRIINEINAFQGAGSSGEDGSQQAGANENYF